MSQENVAHGAPRASAQDASEWLERGRSLVLHSDLAGAIAAFRQGLLAHPGSHELRHALAGALWQHGQAVEAESLLRALVADDPANAAATFLLGKLLMAQGRMLAVEMAVRALFMRPQDTGTLIHAIELLDDCGRKQAASDLVEAAIVAGSDDPRLHAYAGMLSMQVGEFERARARYRFAVDHDARAVEWQSAYGYAMCKRYADAGDPDFDLLRRHLARSDLGARARASLLFALGKACDDIGDAAQAARWLREANGLAATTTDWSRKNWRRLVAARLDAPPIAGALAPADDFVPVFVVGLPRSGTTLVAERLARHARVCNRGELDWIAHLAQRLGHAGRPGQDALARAAATYAAQVRQDDTDARWFIDKQPLNFLHIDLILALFPQARIVHCRRNARDTALSIWMQHFAGREHGFAYDLADIAAVAQGCGRLMAAADKRHASSIHPVCYEELVRDTDQVIGALAAWIGLDAPTAGDAVGTVVISTASAWQARQPVHTRSVGPLACVCGVRPGVGGLSGGLRFPRSLAGSAARTDGVPALLMHRRTLPPDPGRLAPCPRIERGLNKRLRGSF